MLGQPRVDAPTGLPELRLTGRPNPRATQAAPMPGLMARSHARAAHEPGPGKLGDGVLQGVARALAVGALEGVDVQLVVDAPR
eukprot:6519201-Alexandrium_andersonii.AAC.1